MFAVVDLTDRHSRETVLSIIQISWSMLSTFRTPYIDQLYSYIFYFIVIAMNIFVQQIVTYQSFNSEWSIRNRTRREIEDMRKQSES